MHWNTNFYRVSLLPRNFVCLCYRKKKVIIFYFQFCSNFHTKHQNFLLSIRPVPTVIGNFWAKYRFRAHIKHETKSTILQKTSIHTNFLKVYDLSLDNVSQTYCDPHLKSWRIIGENDAQKRPSLFRYFSWTEMDCARSSLVFPLFTFLMTLTSGLCSPGIVCYN